MIISERKGFAFIHNPKCGGTSVRSCLLKFDTINDFFWHISTTDDGKSFDRAHIPMVYLRRYFKEYYNLLDSLFVFMFVRNPYEKCISAFNQVTNSEFLKAVERNEGSAQSGAKETYVHEINSFIMRLDEKAINGCYPEHVHFVRQCDMAYVGSKRKADLILKLENFYSEIEKLSFFSRDLALLLKNAGRENERPRWFNRIEDVLWSDTIKKINSLYEDDFCLFDYDRIQ